MTNGFKNGAISTVWTDLVRERYNSYWAFPPNCVMPEPIPQKVMRLIKNEKGLSKSEQKLLAWTTAISLWSFYV